MMMAAARALFPGTEVKMVPKEHGTVGAKKS